jgi:hypothetical protein
MDEVRCPMCSKKNPADAESCEFCGARIKPLILQSSSQEPPARDEKEFPSPVDRSEEQPDGGAQDLEQTSQETDWLSRMRIEVDDEEEGDLDLSERDEGPKRGETDLLGRFRDLGISSEEKDLSSEDQAIRAVMGEPAELETELPQEEESFPGSDHLSRLRLEIHDEEEGEPDLFENDEGPKRGETDLLGRFRDLGISSDEEDLSIEDQNINAMMEEPTELETEAPHERESSPEGDRLFSQSDEEPEIDIFLQDEVQSESLVEETKESALQEEPPIPDWLARIRARKEVEKSEPPKRTGDTDWLTGLREVTFTDGDEEEKDELPGSLEDLFISDISEELKTPLEPIHPETPIEEELPSEEDDLFSAQASIEDLFSGTDLFEDELEETPSAEPSMDFGLSSPEADDLSDLDDLFSDLKKSASEESGGPTEDDLFGQIESTTAEDIDEIFSDEFFSEVKATEEESRETSDAVLFGKEEAEPLKDEEVRLDAEFFADLGIEIDDDTEKVQQEAPSSDVDEPQVQSPISEIEDREMELSGIQDLAPGSDQLAQEPIFDDLESDEIASSLEEIFDEPSKERSSLSDILGDFSPSWMEDAITDQGGALPHVPALILNDELPLLDSGEGEDDLASTEIPNWLQDLGKDVEEELIEEEDDIPILAKAILPPWLEAMRPIETFRAPPEIELELEEEEEIIEAAGPLAGLKGVLLAEPVVAMPRSAISALGALDISDRELGQADILQQMVEEEEREAGEVEVKHIQLPILRWACAIVLVLAVIVPTVLGGPTFGSPTRAPSDFSPFLDVVETTPLNKPVLLVFDYEPSYSPEMDAVAGALVENLFARGQSMVTLSTKPLGPMLADRMLRRVGNVHDAVNGVDYLHLGYLSGGPAALQLLASTPLSELTQGFNLPEDFEGSTVWESSILSNINQFSDFSMLAVISSGSENAQIWAEQIQPQMGTTPMVMVLSAGTEPIIRPYFEANVPQIDGILSGLPSAMIYEERINGIQADAAHRWNGYGLAVVMTVLILLGGIGYGIANWVIQRSHLRQS